MRNEEFYQNNGYISLAVNNLVGSHELSYLELGLHTGVNHAKVRCKYKVSVDTDSSTNPTHCMTTDDFFAQNKRKFDVIFIDACHEYHQVVADFNHAVECAQVAIFLHDMYPPSADLVGPDKCGDAYKLLYHLVKHTVNLPLTADTDCGLTVVPIPSYAVDPPSSLDTLSYEEFCHDMKYYHRYPIEEFLTVTRRMI